MKDIELAQALMAKFSHDLAGVLGAINNGVDFLKMNDEKTRDRALDLLYSSSEQAVARLQFYRLAYGIAKGPGEANLEEIQGICQKILSPSKFTLHFAKNYFNNPDLFICNNTGKVIMCLLEVVMLSLIYGGNIVINIERTDSGKRISISGAGKEVKIDKEKLSILNNSFDNTPILSSDNVHHFYTARLIKEIPAEITIDLKPGSLEFILDCNI